MRIYIIVILISLLFGFGANSKIIKVEKHPKVHKSLVDSIEFESPKNEKHTIGDKMISRSIEFIKRNLK